MRLQKHSKTDLSTTDQHIQHAVAALLAGEVVVFPTDTVYGLGLAVGIAQSPEILYDIKKRDYNSPIPWLVGGAEALKLYGKDASELSLILAREFWPGPLTIIVKAGEQAPRSFCAQDRTIALRMPNNETALELIKRVGLPLATTSANISGLEAPQDFDCLDPHILSKVSAVLHDTCQRTGVASTIVDCTKDEPVIVREGGISSDTIKAFV